MTIPTGAGIVGQWLSPSALARVDPAIDAAAGDPWGLLLSEGIGSLSLAATCAHSAGSYVFQMVSGDPSGAPFPAVYLALGTRIWQLAAGPDQWWEFGALICIESGAGKWQGEYYTADLPGAPGVGIIRHQRIGDSGGPPVVPPLPALYLMWDPSRGLPFGIGNRFFASPSTWL